MNFSSNQVQTTSHILYESKCFSPLYYLATVALPVTTKSKPLSWIVLSTSGGFIAMYVMEQRPPRSWRPRPPRTSPFPTYDVKIIAGRRVVIFHDRNKEQEKQENDKQQQHEQSNSDETPIPTR